MKAARDFLGPTVKISAYGSSMGGYGAILAAKTLNADHVVAMCPQYPIQQDVVPFERRYRNQAREIGLFRYDINAEIGDKTNYVVIFDPNHTTDRRHEALFKKPKQWVRIPSPGSGHAVLPTLLETVPKGTLLDLIVNRISSVSFRQKIREGRTNSPHYIRRMGNLTLTRHQKFTPLFIDLARKKSYFRMVEKWQGVLLNHHKHRPEIILHPGMPNTGTSAIQLYFKSTAGKYARRGVTYPMEGADAREFSHLWLSSGLRNSDLTALIQQLKSAPPATRKLIFSDESLYVEVPLMAPETRIELKALLAPYSVRIVFCQRPLAAWKKSFYLQALKNRRTATKQGASRLWGTGLSYRRFFEDDFARKLTDINARMADIADLFGADSLEIVQMKPGGNIVPNFCQAAGLVYHQETSNRFVNILMETWMAKFSVRQIT